MKSVLYLTRNGLLEPLGQSQVISYLRGLSRDYRFIIISYEKTEDSADAEAMEGMHKQCEELGIIWLPQSFVAKPKLIAPLFSMIRMVWLTLRETRRYDVKLIHARSYIPAAVAWAVSRLRGTPFVFDMRALWPEELIVAGRLKRGGVLHRVMVWAERACLRDSAGVVSLTNGAVGHLKGTYPRELADRRITVIPTCADLDRFTPPLSPVPPPAVHGCIGTVLSGWFRTEWLATWFKVSADRDAGARFEVLTRDDPDMVRQALDPSGMLAERLRIASKRPDEVAEAIRSHSLSTMFFTDGLSKLGSSPTRMAEVLGTGMPVIANDGVGDVAQIITENRVGVVVEENSEAAMNRAYDALQALIQEPGLAERCVKTARDVFSLEQGTESYRALYADILKERASQ